MAILGASAHIFGENVRAGALFELLAHKLGKIMRGEEDGRAVDEQNGEICRGER